jgi:hypothetical protein
LDYFLKSCEGATRVTARRSLTITTLEVSESDESQSLRKAGTRAAAIETKSAPVLQSRKSTDYAVRPRVEFELRRERYVQTQRSILLELWNAAVER